MALQASHCGTPAPLSTTLLTGRVERRATLTCPPSPTALSQAQPRPGPHEAGQVPQGHAHLFCLYVSMASEMGSW